MEILTSEMTERSPGSPYHRFCFGGNICFGATATGRKDISQVGDRCKVVSYPGRLKDGSTRDSRVGYVDFGLRAFRLKATDVAHGSGRETRLPPSQTLRHLAIARHPTSARSSGNPAPRCRWAVRLQARFSAPSGCRFADPECERPKHCCFAGRHTPPRIPDRC